MQLRYFGSDPQSDSCFVDEAREDEMFSVCILFFLVFLSKCYEFSSKTSIPSSELIVKTFFFLKVCASLTGFGSSVPWEVFCGTMVWFKQWKTGGKPCTHTISELIYRKAQISPVYHVCNSNKWSVVLCDTQTFFVLLTSNNFTHDLFLYCQKSFCTS